MGSTVWTSVFLRGGRHHERPFPHFTPKMMCTAQASKGVLTAASDLRTHLGSSPERLPFAYADVCKGPEQIPFGAA